MTLTEAIWNSDSSGLSATLVCKDESIYEGSIVKELSSGVWFSVGGDPNRVIFFPWTSVVRLVLKRMA